MDKELVEESHEANEASLQSLKIAEGGETPDPAKKSNKAKKYDILLKPTGSAPIMKQKKWAVEGTKTIGSISQFIKKYIKVEAQEKLFLYVNQTFAPSPDQTIKNLYDCYASEGGLVLHYCKTPAWG